MTDPAFDNAGASRRDVLASSLGLAVLATASAASARADDHHTTTDEPFTDPVAAEALLHGNMARVFSEPDPDKRKAALGALWSATPVMFEPGEVLDGPEAILANVARLHERLPPGTRFTPAGPIVGHHDLFFVPWQAGAPGQAPHTLGRDLARLKAGRIDRLWVFLDKHL